ncbi:poly(glycerol-phosphate) alpha-glucosyltransferase [Staphylococcus canis]|uniref:Poly(Glycerol-phosphate) alpha-glucosyltransferase n=1 Tax=Staphylococcus canis TaxID=2724942 RepID=A0ABS0TAF1_9STAP|nr:poly(glycerol-phosphate) alpha-glucosyltransferase [Staphylococcus canis]MBI5975707.1 poly(glycerol-phosphate) alpha-glucosyltransferase [Staphylococcus canis]
MKDINEVLNYVQKIKEREQFEQLFISVGNEHFKARVKHFNSDNYLIQNIEKFIRSYEKKATNFPRWVKIDIVTHTKSVNFDVLLKEMIQKRRNYIDYGVSFDSSFRLSFLPEEINANAFIKPEKKNANELVLSDHNINHYLKHYTSHIKKFKQSDYTGKQVIQFWTRSYFIEDENVYVLHDTGSQKGLRVVNDLSSEVDHMIMTSTEYLKNEIQPNGKYHYGYFSHFDREIHFYNILRHCSSTYALTEGLSYLGASLDIVKRALQYVMNNALFYYNDVAYIFDDTRDINEIKLGQNAAFIFAACEYLKHHPEETSLLKIAQDVAKGILSMINHNTMDTIHVLNYPDLSIKESFRIIYYDGEAALALLRLYQIDGNEIWLNTVEKLVERFIAQSYWKHHDHWIGYCVNELVQIKPKKTYFELGIRNASSYLNYIYHRETAFPTFLEMLMATYHLIQKAKEEGYTALVDSLIDEGQLIDTIHKRADYQRTGYFYPELAMYFKNPKRILGSFFIKHHGYRVRIDDIEHYLSGYIQYQQVFKSSF